MTTQPTSAETKNDRIFFGFVAGSNALAFGALFATIESVHQSPSGFVFQTGGGTWAAFAIGAVIGLIVWEVVSHTPAARASLVMRGTLLLLVLCGLGAFLYPLRFLKAQTLIEVSEGLGVAAIALTSLGLIFWRIMRALDSDTAENETVAELPATDRFPASTASSKGARAVTSMAGPPEKHCS